MYFILCALTFVICFAVQVNSQLAPKRIGEWSPDRHHMYPNPWEDASQCNTTQTSGLCDYNNILTPEQRMELSGQPEMNVTHADKGNLCKNVDGKIRIMVTVAIMKKIGPHITDYRAAAKEFAEKFRPAWNLHNCSVILVASNLDNTSFLEAGPDVVKLLTSNVTDKIDLDVYQEYFMKGLLLEGINAVVSDYRTVLETAALQATVPLTTTPATAPTTEQTDESGASSGYTPIIVGVIIGVIVVLIVIIVVIIVIKNKARKGAANEKESRHLSGPADV